MLHRPHAKQREPARALALLVGLGAVAVGLDAKAQDLGGSDSQGSEDLTETIPPSNGDVDESVEPDTASPDAPPAGAAPATRESGPDKHIQLTGYARQSLELVYGELAREARSLPEPPPVNNCPDTPCLWRDIFVSRTQLVLRASYVEERRFEATVSGMLGYALHVAAKAPQYSNDVVDLARGELDPQLREAYVGFFWPAVDLRIGQQRVAWGRSDFQSPNDVINARDLRDPFLSESELRYLPTPLIRSSVTVGAFSLEGIVSPLFIPDRFDVYGSNWSPFQFHSDPDYRGFLGGTTLLVDQSVEREFAQLWRQTERPLDNGKGAAAGARLIATLPGIDLSAYYHYGFDATPYVSLHPRFLEYLHGTQFLTAPATKFEPLLVLIDDLKSSNEVPFSARYLRRHHAGFDLAAPLGPIVLRLDAAYESRRVFYRVDFNGFASPTILGVAALEYQTGDLDKVLLLEFLAQHMLNQTPEYMNQQGQLVHVPLLAYDRTTSAVAGTLRWTLAESWGIDLRGLVGIHPETYSLQPAIRFKPNDSFQLRLGALILAGKQQSFGWYYGDNDTAFIQLRYAF